MYPNGYITPLDAEALIGSRKINFSYPHGLEARKNARTDFFATCLLIAGWKGLTESIFLKTLSYADAEYHMHFALK